MKNAFKNLKHYAKIYGISVLTESKPKSVNELAIDIYEYERDNNIKDGFYPFSYIKTIV
jgi:hypothetical protein